MRNKLAILLVLCLLCAGMTVGSAEGASERQMYYDYLQNAVIPEIGLANLSTTSVMTKNYDSYAAPLLEEAGFTGLASATVRDFDGDGDEEMLTLSVMNTNFFHTWLRLYYSEDFWLDRCVSLQMDLYSIENGQVVHKATETSLTQLDGYSWGPLAAGLDKCGETIYIWGRSFTENMNVYGPSPFTVYHIENDQFVMDYVDGLDWGQISLEQEFSEVQNTHLLIRNLTLGDIEGMTAQWPASHTEWRENLGNRLLLDVYLEPDYAGGNGAIKAEGFDYTNLKAILNEGAAAYPEAALPEGSPMTVEGAEDLAATAEAFANELISVLDMQTQTKNGILRVDCTTFGNELRLEYDVATGKLTHVALFSDELNADEDWYRIKDALLQNPDFGFDAAAIAPMLGDNISWVEFSGTDVGGAKVGILQVMNCCLNIYFD